MRYIYIDSENIGCDRWCPCLDYLEKLDTVFVFYTENSKPIKVSNLGYVHNCKANIELVEVQCGRQNALDFILVSYLSRKTLTAVKSRHIIVSGDTGYDTVVDHFRKEKLNVVRLGKLQEEFKNRNGDLPKRLIVKKG